MQFSSQYPSGGIAATAAAVLPLPVVSAMKYSSHKTNLPIDNIIKQQEHRDILITTEKRICEIKMDDYLSLDRT